MPTVNTSCIQARYDEQLARLYNVVNYTSDDILSYALSGVDLNDVGIIVAADVNSLPSLQYGDPPIYNIDGMVYFVQSLGIIVISSNNTWLSLDGVVIRTDNIEYLSWAWGAGGGGRLGDNSITNKSSPVSVVGGFTDWLQVAPGAYHSTGVKQNGTAWAWGCNDVGQLGDNSITNRSSPVSVVGGFTDWCQISAGWKSSSAVRQNGTAWGWGSGGTGRLGDNSITNRSSPVSVVGGFTDWCQISSGYSHTLAVRQNGTLWAWGAAGNGALGDNNINNTSSPVSVVGGFTDWCQVSAGGFGGASAGFSVAVRQNGTVWAWGFNNCGQLGDNSITNRSSPVSVVGGFTNWCQVSASDFYNDSFSNGVRQNGTLWSWGGNNVGQLGDNSITNRSSPVSVVGGFTDWCQITASYLSALGVRTNGTLWGWGSNGSGQLGDGTVVSKRSPVSVVGGFTDWCQVSAAFGHVVALRVVI
jgi:alpha-tubulin suppressor-like RCC1 family protein